MSGNYVTVIGNLTRDPETNFTPGGAQITKFSIAHNHRFKKGDEWESKASYVDCVIWGDLGSNVVDSLEKGARVIVVGRFDQNTWETSEGEKRSKIELVVESCGPDLTWATAVVTRVEQDEKSERKSSGGGKKATPRGRASKPEPDYDEEPF